MRRVSARVRIGVVVGAALAVLVLPTQASATTRTYKGAFDSYPRISIQFTIAVKNGVKKLKSFDTGIDSRTGVPLPIKCDEGTYHWGASGIASPPLKLKDNAWIFKSSDATLHDQMTFSGELTNGGHNAVGVLKHKGDLPGYHNCDGKYAWSATRK